MFVKKKAPSGKLFLSAVGEPSGEKSPVVSILQRTTSRLLNIEREARELATDMQVSGRGLGAREALSLKEDLAYRVCGPFSEHLLAAEPTSEFFQPVASAVKAAWHAVEGICRDYKHSYMDDEDALARGQEVTPNLNPEVSADTEKALESLEQAVRAVTGRGCRYAVSNTTASALNDVAACVHRLAEHLLSQISRPEKVGKCDVLRGSSRQAVDFCARWSLATEELQHRRLYWWDDYSVLWGYTLGNEVYIRVGSAVGHRTHIDLNQGSLRYYDNDDNVNRVMSRLLSEEAGLSCEVLDDGVACTGIDPTNVDKVAAALAFATSMDIRLKWPKDYWRNLYEEAEGETSEDAELNLAKRTLREVLRKISSTPKELAHTILALRR